MVAIPAPGQIQSLSPAAQEASARAFIPDIFSNLGDFISRSLRFKIAYLSMSWKLKVLMSTKYLLSNMIIQQYLE